MIVVIFKAEKFPQMIEMEKLSQEATQMMCTLTWLKLNYQRKIEIFKVKEEINHAGYMIKQIPGYIGDYIIYIIEH